MVVIRAASDVMVCRLETTSKWRVAPIWDLFAGTLPDVVASFLTGGRREQQRTRGTRARPGHEREQHRTAPEIVVFCHRYRSKRC
jgi:hypothetical protein